MKPKLQVLASAPAIFVCLALCLAAAGSIVRSAGANPEHVNITGVSIDPGAIGVSGATVTVHFDGPVPAGGGTVNLGVDAGSGVVDLPAQVAVGEGATSADAQLSVVQQGAGGVTVSASGDGGAIWGNDGASALWSD